MLPLILGGLEAAAEAAPAIGAFATRALPLIGAAAGAIPKLRQGDPLGAVLQGGLGYVGGKGVQGLTNFGSRMAGQKLAQTLAPVTGSAISAAEAAGAIPGIGKVVPGLAEGASLAQKARLGSAISGAAKALTPLAVAGVPLAGAAYLAQQAFAGGGGQGGGYGGGYGGGGGIINPGNVGGGAVQFLGGGPSAVPGTPDLVGMAQQNLQALGGPFGPGQQPTLYTALGPGGAGDVARKWIEKNADVDRAIALKAAAAEAPYNIGYKSADLLNQLAAAGIRQNIATQAANIQGGLQFSRDVAKQAAADIGMAGRTLYQYQ